jgi:hypothetical protein
VPGAARLSEQGIIPHFGTPGGVVPRIADSRVHDIDLV